MELVPLEQIQYDELKKNSNSDKELLQLIYNYYQNQINIFMGTKIEERE